MRFLAASIIISALVALFVGIKTLDSIATRDAQIFELESEVADLWIERQECISQLGVFFRPRNGKEVKNDQE